MKSNKFIFVLLCSLMIGCANAGDKSSSVSIDSESTSQSSTTSSDSASESTTSSESSSSSESESSESESSESESSSSEEPIDELPDSLIAKWEFSGLESGVLKDISKEGGHNATASGNPTFVTDGDLDYVNFTTGGQHFDLYYCDDLNFSHTQAFSAVARFKWSGSVYNNWPCIFNKGLMIETNQYRYYGLWIEPSSHYLEYGSTNPSGGCYNSQSLKVLDTEWHVAKIVQDPVIGKTSYYLDDVYQGFVAPFNAVSSAGLYIGYNGSDAYGSQFLGAIDYIEIYNEAIEVNEKPRPKGIDDMEAGSYTYYNEYLKTNLTYPYKVYYPTGYKEGDGSTKYPFLLFLHGHGECGADNAQQLKVLGGPNQLLNDVIANDNCVVLAPQVPHAQQYVTELNDYYSKEWVSINEQWNKGSRSELPSFMSGGMIAACNLLDQFLANPKIDTNRIYVSGISMGGYGTWELITRRPEIFAAAIPLCGAGFPSYAESLKNINIWAFHGSADTTVPSSGTKDMETALKAVGGKIQATYFSGVGHDVWTYAYATDGLVDWLMSQHK